MFLFSLAGYIVLSFDERIKITIEDVYNLIDAHKSYINDSEKTLSSIEIAKKINEEYNTIIPRKEYQQLLDVIKEERDKEDKIRRVEADIKKEKELLQLKTRFQQL